jgi:uncharacterized membrane protein YfcA
MLLPPDISPANLVLLFLVAVIGGTVDAIAGGGGLLTLPALLATGMPAPVALATNKLQGTFGSGSATWHYIRRGAVDPRECVLGGALTALGAIGGTLAVQVVDPGILGEIIPWLLGGIVLYFVFRPQLGESSRHHRMEPRPFYIIFGLLLGAYDGFFGPGVGSFWTIAFIVLLGHDFVRAAAHTKVMNFSSNVASLAVFTFSGLVAWLPGLVMASGQVLGGRLGAHLAMTRGARFVRPIFLVMAALIVAKMIYGNYFRN